MTRKKLLMLIGSVCLALMLALPLVASCAAPTPTPTPTPTERVISWTAYDIGSSGYAQTAGVGSALMSIDIKLRVVPCGDDISRLVPVRTGDVDFALVGLGSYFAEQALDQFADRAWGPQPMRLIIQVPPLTATGAAIMVRGDSGIKVPADLKGKRYAWLIASPSCTMIVEAVLAYAGLTWDDVEIIEFPSYSAACRAVVDGSADFVQCSTAVGAAYELEASIHGVGWLTVDPDDKEGWERLRKVMPPIFSFKATAGAGILEEKPIWMTGQMYPILCCWDWQDEDLVYRITKAIQDTYDLYKDAHPGLPGWKVEKGLAIPPQNPYHPGAIKYYKEIGLWTAENDEWQKEGLEVQAKLKAAWEAAIEEADEKGISAKDFPDFWMEKRAEALK